MRLGIVGGGQLGQMLTQAALPLGIEVTVLDPQDGCPATIVGARQIVGRLSSETCLKELAEQSDVVTWEVEHIGAAALVDLEREGCVVHPSPGSLLRIQDKLQQKRDLRAAGLPVGDFYAAQDFKDLLIDGGDQARFIVKQRWGGFDGRGNGSPGRYDEVLADLDDHDSYVERMVPFQHEVAVLAVRDRNGGIALYPPVETFQVDSICVSVEAPAQLDESVVAKASVLGQRVASTYDGAGVFAVEMFVADGELLINEVAPRVHNSGHFTIEGSVTSQFENHVRAVVGYPLGSTASRQFAVMMNLLGPPGAPLHPDGVAKSLAEADTHVHLYGKSWRPGRKLGHLTSVGRSIEETRQTAARARGYFEP